MFLIEGVFGSKNIFSKSGSKWQGEDPFPFFCPLGAILDFAGNVALGNVALQAVSQCPPAQPPGRHLGFCRQCGVRQCGGRQCDVAGGEPVPPGSARRKLGTSHPQVVF